MDKVNVLKSSKKSKYYHMINDEPLQPSVPSKIDTLSKTQYIEDIIFKQLREINLNKVQNFDSMKKSRNRNIKVTSYHQKERKNKDYKRKKDFQDSYHMNGHHKNNERNHFSKEFEYISNKLNEHSHNQNNITSEISHIKNEMEGIKNNLNLIEHDINLIKSTNNNTSRYRHNGKEKLKTIQVEPRLILESEKNLKIKSKEQVSVGRSAPMDSQRKYIYKQTPRIIKKGTIKCSLKIINKKSQIQKIIFLHMG